jgi:hypothetical protein
MSIAAYTHTANFTIIGNACFNDERLSFEALAIFTYLRSKPSDWTVRQTELARRFKAGRDRVRNAINELIAAGYIRKVQERIAGRWSAADYDVLALPDAPAPEAPLPETPSPENRSLLSTDLLPSTDSAKEDNIPRAARAAESSEPNPPGALPEESKESGNVGIRTGLPRSSNEERCPRTYRQSPAEAARAWSELKRLDWSAVWGDDEMTHWHTLLRKGHAADDIVGVALNFLCETPEHDVPSLGDFLACFESYLEDEAEDAAVSPSPPRAAQRQQRSLSMTDVERIERALGLCAYRLDREDPAIDAVVVPVFEGLECDLAMLRGRDRALRDLSITAR